MPVPDFRCGSLLALLLLVLSTSAPHAQFDTGSIVGTVRDTSGAVIPNATVTLTSSATGLSVTKRTDAEGNYEFFTVRPGIYLVTAEQTGFALALVENVQVQVAARVRVDRLEQVVVDLVHDGLGAVLAHQGVGTRPGHAEQDGRDDGDFEGLANEGEHGWDSGFGRGVAPHGSVTSSLGSARSRLRGERCFHE